MAYRLGLRIRLRHIRKCYVICLVMLCGFLLWGFSNSNYLFITFVKREVKPDGPVLQAESRHWNTECIIAHQPSPDESNNSNKHNNNNKTAESRTLIRFTPMVYSPDIDNFTFDNAHLFPCTQPNGSVPGEVEDLMCLPRPAYLPDYKNPCYINQTGQLDCLPYYHILGFDKSASTDLSARIQAHPSILKSQGLFDKEMFYWCWRRYGFLLRKVIEPITLSKYTDYFSNARNVIAPLVGQPNQPIVGDASPNNGWDFRGWNRDPQNKGLSEPKVLAPQHMRHILKHPKFIFIMREPTERLYSDYYFHQFGHSPEKFAKDAVKAIDIMNSCLKVNTTRQCFYSFDIHRALPGFIHIGCYSLFLREWLSVFHRKHFFFIRTEDYSKDMTGSLRQIFSFLGVDTLSDSMMDSIAKRDRKMQTKTKEKAGPMFEETRKLLQEFYEPCNQDLRKLLGDDRYLWLDTRDSSSV